MKVKQKPLSFSLCAENIAYVEEEYGTRHRNRSHWMDDLLTHLRLKKTAPATQVVVVEKPKAKTKRKVFVAPTVEEVREYCDSRCNDVDPEKFIAHYNTNGWVRGKAETKIKCWKSCVQTWEGNNKPAAKSNESLQGDW